MAWWVGGAACAADGAAATVTRMHAQARAAAQGRLGVMGPFLTSGQDPEAARTRRAPWVTEPLPQFSTDRGSTERRSGIPTRGEHGARHPRLRTSAGVRPASPEHRLCCEATLAQCASATPSRTGSPPRDGHARPAAPVASRSVTATSTQPQGSPIARAAFRTGRPAPRPPHPSARAPKDRVLGRAAQRPREPAPRRRPSRRSPRPPPSR